MTGLARPGLAAVTLDPRGGGIAAVSRLVREVLARARREPCPAWTLVPARRADFHASIASRVAFGARLAAAQTRGACDWVCYTHLGLATVQSFVPPPVRRPYVVFLHDVEAWSPLPRRRAAVLAGAAVRVANSRFTADRVASVHGACGAVVPCPLALADDWIAPGPRPASARRKTILIVGRMVASERYKGHDELLEALPAVVAAVPDARLVCAGAGDDVDRLREKATALGVGAAVTFTGFVDAGALRALYRDAAVFAMPSRREGFGLVYLEAMASGLPCVASLDDAAREVVVDGETGYLVTQAAVPALAARLRTLLADHALCQRLGDAGRARYEREFTQAAFSARFMSILAAAPALLRADREWP